MRRIPWNTSVTFFFLASYKTNFLLKAEGGFPVCVLRSVTNPVCHKHPHTALHLPAGDCSKVFGGYRHTQPDLCKPSLSQQALNESSSRVPPLVPWRALIPCVPSYCNTQNLDAIPSFLKEKSVKPEPRAGHALSASPGDSSVTPGEQRGAGRTAGAAGRAVPSARCGSLWTGSRWLPQRGRLGGLTRFQHGALFELLLRACASTHRRVTQLICAELLCGRSTNPTSLVNQWAVCRCEKQGSLQTPQKKKKKRVRSSWETEELKKTIATSQSTYPNHPPTTSFICWRTSKTSWLLPALEGEQALRAH